MEGMIKLSDAIREGSANKSQCTEAYVQLSDSSQIADIKTLESLSVEKLGESFSNVRAVCVLGAAWCGGVNLDDLLKNRITICRQIFSWNDYERLSFEEIADKLDEEYPNLEVLSWKE